MKKFLRPIVIAALLVSSYSGFSQEIGARWGDALGNNIALDAVVNFGSFSRMHLDFTFGDDFGLEMLGHFINKPIGQGGLNIYSGIGLSLYFGDPFLLGVAGEIGLEYRFANAPFVIGADWRPVYVFEGGDSFDTGGFGVNARFAFGKRKE